MNENRRAWVRKAYNKLDVNKDGRVTLEDVAKIYDASCHPDVVQRRKTEEDVFREFMTQWDTREKDGIVTFEEFCDYFEGVSCSVDSDDYFATMMKNAWKL